MFEGKEATRWNDWWQTKSKVQSLLSFFSMLDLFKISTPITINKAPTNHWNDNASSNKKKPARPEQRKLAEKFVPVACNEERAFKLLT